MAQRKQLLIQPFKQSQHMDGNAARTVWTSLSEAIDEIYMQNASQLSFEVLYRYSYNLVMQKHGDLLYEGVKSTLSKHLSRSADLVAGASHERLLDVMAQEWAAHTVAFNMIKDILMYMDRSYCEQKKKPTVLNLAKELFRQVVVDHDQVGKRLRFVLLEQIALERSGCIIDRNLMKKLIEMLCSLGSSGVTVYEEEFETFFLIETEQFYHAESLQYISSNPCAEYIRKVEGRLLEEADRLNNYVAASTEPKLRRVLDQELIARHAQALIDMEASGLFVMFREERIDELKRLYNLFHRVQSCLDLLRDNLGRYVVKCGREILSTHGADGNKDSITFVKQILELKAKFDLIIREAFRGDKKMIKQLKDSFESFVNQDNRCAAFLADYLDDLLCSKTQICEEDMESKIDQALTIFRYLSNKDIFEQFYQKKMAKRLLANKSSSDEIEKSVIARLKAECGYQFTSKLESMLIDNDTSKGVMDGFRASRDFHLLPCDLEVRLLSVGWVMTPTPPCRLPPAVDKCMSLFHSYYSERNNGKKLNWFTTVGSVDIKANMPSGKYELNVSVYQMCILLLFNGQDTISLSTLAQTIQVADSAEFNRHLLSLCTPKHRLLVKASKGKYIESQDQFTFNADFTSKLKRIKVPLILMKETASAEEEKIEDGLPSQVEEMRKHQVEAAIVRVMKSRKTLSHHDLIAEVTRQLSYRFLPSPQFIRKSIEALIEREYLQRHPDDPRLYNYLA